MSLERPQQPPESDTDPAALAGDASGPLDVNAFRRVLSDAILTTEEYVHALAVQIRPDTVQSSFSALRDNLGLNHLPCVTAQEYEDRYESVYHLKSYDNPTREASVVAPTSRSDSVSESTTPVFRTAEWHERETYDLVGTQYENHPSLRRTLLPGTWQSHPLGLDYDRMHPQVVRYDENANPFAENDRADTNMMLLSTGLHHPVTHSVMHLQVTLSGGQVVDVGPNIGHIRRCEEQVCQQGTYRRQIMPYPDRWDWGGGGLLNEWTYVRTTEVLADIDIPEYAQVFRTLTVKLSHILLHMLVAGAYALDVIGDFTATFTYAMRDHELVQNILENLTGRRLMLNYFRFDGVIWDLPEPCEEFLGKIRTLVDSPPERLREYHDLPMTNEILQARTVEIGVLSPEVAKDYSVTGSVARGSGIDHDLRRDDPHDCYGELD